VGISAGLLGHYFTTSLPLPAYLKLSVVGNISHPTILKQLLPVVFSLQAELCSAISVWLVLLLLAALLSKNPLDVRTKAISTGTLAFFVYLFAVVPIMNLEMRYQAPLLIPAIFVGIASLATLIQTYSGTSRTHGLSRLGLYVVLILGTFGTIPSIKSETRDNAHDHQIFKPLGIELSRIPDLSIASSEAGVLAYYSDGRFLDLIGLNNTFVSLNHKKPGYDTALDNYLATDFGYPDLYVRKIGYVDTYADLCSFPKIISRFRFVGEIAGAGSPGLFVLKVGPNANKLMQVITHLHMLPSPRPDGTLPTTTAEGCAAATDIMNSDLRLRGE
jgi:hypothetical protein